MHLKNSCYIKENSNTYKKRASIDILIVDDDEVDRRLLNYSLSCGEHNYYKITEANSVKNSLYILETQYFDVILLDYNMPEDDGIELVKELRSRPNLGNTAIIMISGSENINLSLKSIEVGAQDFINKNEITRGKLERAILHAQKRFKIEQRLHENYRMAKELSESDSLTGLANRYYFEKKLKSSIKKSEIDNSCIALLILDFDDFKHVNDSLGHDSGDIVLVNSVKRILKILKKNEVFARLGGDEFAVIIYDVSSVNDVHELAKSIRDTFNMPFLIGDNEVHLGVSIGAALSPRDAKNSQDFLKCADIAMYKSKTLGQGSICFYRSFYQKEFNRRFKIKNDINNILLHSEFKLYYQPIFDLSSNSILGFEALIRWPLNDKSARPDEFIPIAEECGLINKLGDWIIDTAIKQISIWQKISKNLSISINISPIQLQQPDLVNYLLKTSKKYNVLNESITLEITETALFKDNEKIISTLNTLSVKGFKIALDDFGMGSSSISHLINYPIDIVKLDKSLLSFENIQGRKQQVFESLALMLRALDFIVIAEGVEIDEQLIACQKLNIHRIQGFLLAEPMPVVKVNNLLKVTI